MNTEQRPLWYVQGKAKKEPAAKETPVLASMVAHMVTGVQVSDVKRLCKVQIETCTID